jgi:hypothetical protein
MYFRHAPIASLFLNFADNQLFVRAALNGFFDIPNISFLEMLCVSGESRNTRYLQPKLLCLYM